MRNRQIYEFHGDDISLVIGRSRMQAELFWLSFYGLDEGDYAAAELLIEKLKKCTVKVLNDDEIVSVAEEDGQIKRQSAADWINEFDDVGVLYPTIR